MAITEKDTIDSVAYEKNTLIMQLYDHLDFEGKFEYDHLVMLQDKLNTYIWYVDSKQYQETYPDKKFENFLIKIFFVCEITELCEKFIRNVNLKLQKSNIHIDWFVEKYNEKK